jgi:hypothetical protein
MDSQTPPNEQNNRPATNSSQPVDDYQAASQATAEQAYNDYTSKGKVYSVPTHKLRKVLIVLLVLLILGGGGFSAYWFLIRKDTKSSAEADKTPGQQTATVKDEKMFATETEHHTSQYFMLEFDYPNDWTIEETSDSGKLTARSPAVQLKNPSGQTYNGQVVLTIRNKQQALPEFDKGNAVAALASEKIDYSKPSSVQRGSTYLSFLRYASSTSTKSLDGLYITGDVGYQKDQAIPKADFTPVDPIISVTFVKCTASACTGEGTASSIAATMWEDTLFSGPMTTMLKSLIVN